MIKMLSRMWHEEDGQGMVEYGLIVALISVAAVTALTTMKTELDKLYRAVVNSIRPVTS